MYNKFFEYLLNNEPKKVISKYGIFIRKLLNPFFVKVIVPLSTKNKLIVERKETIPKNKPVIFAATHGFRDDVASALKIIGKHTYILCGSLPDFYESTDGWALWLNGVIMVDRNDKQSRRASKAKVEYTLNLGTNILMYPEGTWNRTENMITLKLFPGIYDIAAATGALIMPLATIQEGNRVYAILEKPFNILNYDRKKGIDVLRDKMATAKYELMEKYSFESRSNIKNPKQHWKKFIEELIASAKGHYDVETEDNAYFIDKNITEYDTAFEHLNHIEPNRKTAFLFNKRFK